MRKPIQLLSHRIDDGPHVLLAVCDDGTMWQLDGLGMWKRIESIPPDGNPTNLPQWKPRVA